MSTQLIVVSMAALIGFVSLWWLSAPLRQQPRAHQRRVILLLALVILASGSVYLILGSPEEADQPLAPRLEGALTDLPPAAILVRLEQQLRVTPDDAQGWRLMARLRGQVKQYPQAADAWRRVLALNEGDAEAYGGLAQALIEVDAGVVSDPAIALLDKALELDPRNMVARFWRGMAWQQQNQPQEAARLWQAMREDLPDNIPLARILDERLQSLK
jgi:cytochrome c-type biogenesis protein CcmH